MSNAVSGVLLAGVHDWGACPLNHAVIRPLAPVANRPIISHALEALVRAGAADVAVCTNGHVEPIRRSLDQHNQSDVRLVYNDRRMPRGPAGCVKDAAAMLYGDVLVVAEANVLPAFDIGDMVRAHVQSGAAATVATLASRGEVHTTHEPVGVYVFSKNTVHRIARKGYQDIKEGLIPSLHRASLRVDAYPIDGVAPRVSGIAGYLALHDGAVRMAIDGDILMEDYMLVGQSLIHLDARVDPSARLLGPVVVGPGCVIQADAIVAGPTALGSRCTIGRGAVVSRSIVWAGGSVHHGAHVDRCVVTDGAEVKPNDRCYRTVHLAERRNRTVMGRFRRLVSAGRDWPRKPTRRSAAGSGQRLHGRPEGRPVPSRSAEKV